LKATAIRLGLVFLVPFLIGCSGPKTSPSVTPTPKPAAQATAQATPRAGTTTTPTVVAVTPGPNRQQVRVIRVIDGDTLELEGGQRVRYIGVDTPEMNDSRASVRAWAEKGKEKNRGLVEGKTVTLERDVSETDKYGRLLRYVYVNGVMVNSELIRLGFAFATPYPPDVKHQDLFAQLEKEARTAGAGLWGDR